MAQTKLQQKLVQWIKQAGVVLPWTLLDRTVPYDPNTYAYPLRKGTMPPVVRLYAPLIEAASMYSAEIYEPIAPFRLCEKASISHPKTFLEAQMPDGTSFLVLCEYRGGKDYKLRVSVVETDGTRGPAQAFKHMSPIALSCICLALWPDILTTDASSGNGKITEATNELSKAADNRVASPWADKFDIPDIAKESAYMLDAVLSIFKEEMTIDCGDDASDTPAEIEDSYFNNGMLEGKLIHENFGSSGWTPIVLTANGKAKKRGKAGTITIAAAKDEFSVFSADRKWTAAERKLIPSLPDDMPVMPEVVYMAKLILNTRYDKNPICTGMWRGDTGIGKSTGMKQLACILNVPFLTQTCHPSMEAQDFQSMFVPASSPEESVESFDLSSLDAPVAASVALGNPEASFDYALSYVASLEPEKQKDLVENDAQFFETALMDQEEAEAALFGCAVSCELPDLLAIYNKVRTEFIRKTYEGKIEKLTKQAQEPATGVKNGPEFKHVYSPYMRAMTRGWMCEVQEASRIRNSGVMVSINEFDRPNSTMQLVDGNTVKRHASAICVFTDNVGYDSCRPVDPSVIRRMGFVIDSSELSTETLIERVKYNTGVTDDKLLTIAYNLWDAVRQYCRQNSINEGSTSPVELERLCQALKHNGMENLSEDLDNCVISKATSSIEDQREIRSVCSVLIPAA